MQEGNENNTPRDGSNDFAMVVGLTGVLGLLAIGLSFLFSTPLLPQIAFNLDGLAWGLVGTVPLAIFLYLFTRTNIGPLVELRESQIDFFAQIGFELSPVRIAALAAAAGICEELLFRGVFQTWLATMGTMIGAILLSNLVFGLLHFRTFLYAVIAGAVGIYLGVFHAATGNLLVPIIIHGLYDALALGYAKRALENRAAT